MGEVAFDNGIIRSHDAYALCGTTLDAVSKKDYPREDFFDKNIACLDMDAYEIETCKSGRGRTMDAVIGIKTFSNNKFQNTRLLLVELRMDYKSDNNLSKTELEQKVAHTKSLLGNASPLDNINCFVFRSTVINRVRRWFNDKTKEGGSLKYCKPISTDEFNDFIKSEDEFPYVPQTDLRAMEKELSNLLSVTRYSDFIQKVEYWIVQAQSYRNRYNRAEFRCIMEVISKEWKTFRTLGLVLSDEEKLDADILEEEYPWMMDM